MKESLRLRLDQLSDRHEELTALLADVEVISDNKRFRQLSREHNDLTEITNVLEPSTDRRKKTLKRLRPCCQIRTLRKWRRKRLKRIKL